MAECGTEPVPLQGERHLVSGGEWESSSQSGRSPGASARARSAGSPSSAKMPEALVVGAAVADGSGHGAIFCFCEPEHRPRVIQGPDAAHVTGNSR